MDKMKKICSKYDLIVRKLNAIFIEFINSSVENVMNERCNMIRRTAE